MDSIVLVIITALISGLLVTVVTIWWQQKTEIRNRKILEVWNNKNSMEGISFRRRIFLYSTVTAAEQLLQKVNSRNVKGRQTVCSQSLELLNT